MQQQPNVKRMPVAENDLDGVYSLSAQYGKGRPAAFSINPDHEIWPRVGKGLTPKEERHRIEGLIPLVDTIGSLLLSWRDLGGRFFIDDEGAWVRPGAARVQFVAFDLES